MPSSLLPVSADSVESMLLLLRAISDPKKSQEQLDLLSKKLTDIEEAKVKYREQLAENNKQLQQFSAAKSAHLQDVADFKSSSERARTLFNDQATQLKELENELEARRLGLDDREKALNLASDNITEKMRAADQTAQAHAANLVERERNVEVAKSKLEQDHITLRAQTAKNRAFMDTAMKAREIAVTAKEKAAEEKLARATAMEEGFQRKLKELANPSE